jgi:hypothetical protein
MHEKFRMPGTPRPLIDAEFESESLERFGNKRPTNLEAPDGFPAAMTCGHGDVLQSEYLQLEPRRFR